MAEAAKPVLARVGAMVFSQGFHRVKIAADGPSSKSSIQLYLYKQLAQKQAAKFFVIKEPGCVYLSVSVYN